MNVPSRALAAAAHCGRGAIRRRSYTFLLTLVGFLAARPCSAYDVLLRWTVPGPGIAGYRIYSGGASRTYDPPIDVGRLDNSTSSGVVYYLYQNLQLGSADYVAVTAYNFAGMESDYSNEAPFNLASATPPSLNPQPDQTATLGSVVSLGSTPDNGINYFWVQTAGPAATLSSRTTSRTQFTPMVSGTYTFALTAYDAKGVAARDSVTVVVGPAPTPTMTATSTRTPQLTPTRTRTPTLPSAVSNDTCANAQIVAVAPYSSAIFTSGATTDASDPAVVCGNGSRTKSVWYRFTAPSNGTLTANTFGSNYDTILASYTGVCGALVSAPGACNDDASGTQSRISFAASAGTTYYFLVSAYSNNGGTLSFQLTFQEAGPTSTRTPTALPTSTFTSGPPTPTAPAGSATATVTVRPTLTAAAAATPMSPGEVVNDACNSAVIISGASYASTLVTSSATSDPTDPAPSCGNRSRARSVWYQFTAPSTGSLAASTFGSSYDTILSAYTGTCGAWAPVACNDDSSGMQSRIAFTAIGGATYYFLVSSYTGNGGTLAFQLTFQGSGQAPQPTPTLTAAAPTATRTPTSTPGFGDVWNDACANALQITALPFTSTVLTTMATTEATDPAPGCGNSSRAKSMWYRFTAPANGTLTANTFGSSYDTILAVYTGTCGAFALLPGGCNDDSNALQSRVSFQATAGVTYYFMATAYTSNSGTLKLTLSY